MMSFEKVLLLPLRVLIAFSFHRINTLQIYVRSLFGHEISITNLLGMRKGDTSWCSPFVCKLFMRASMRSWEECVKVVCSSN